MIPLTAPNLGEAEQQAMQACLASGWVSSAGPQVAAFEDRMAAWCTRDFAVAVSSGTAALHLALLAAGVQPGDLVPVPALTFIATANAVRYCGAEPLFIDADPISWQPDALLLEEFLHGQCEMRGTECYHRPTGRRMSALVAVDVLGHIGLMEKFAALAETYSLVLIEDAAGALGSAWNGKPAGSFGRISTLSFNGNKILTTGGGGMLLTDQEVVARRVRHLSTQARTHASEYVHDEVGYNYRMAAMNAALGLAQFSRFPELLRRKHEVFDYYNAAFADLGGVCPFRPPHPELYPNHWLYTLTSEQSRPLQAFLRSKGIQSGKLWQPLFLQSPYRDCIYYTRDHHAVHIYENSLSLPCSTGITDEELEKVAEAVREFFKIG